MRFIFGFLAVALLCCGGSATDERRITGHVAWETVEGGFWAIRSDDGVTYEPLEELPAAFQKDQFPIVAWVVLRSDLGSARMVGPIVEIVSIESR